MNREEIEMLTESFDVVYHNVSEKLKREAKYYYLDIDATPKSFGEQYAGSKKCKHNNIKRKKRK